MALETILVLLIIFIATLVRATFGFGESLVAVPLLVWLLPIEIAVPLSVLISVLVAAFIVVQDRAQIHLSSAKWLIIFAIPGIPIGLLLLVYGNEHLVKALLGLLIVLYALYSLLGKQALHLKADNKAMLFACGFLSGVFGGAYGLNGPPLVLYGHMRKWSPQHFRATLQAYFLPASTLGIMGYWYQGFWNTTLLYYFLLSIPVVIPTIFLSRYLNRQMKTHSFRKWVYAGLTLAGLVLLLQPTIRFLLSLQ